MDDIQRQLQHNQYMREWRKKNPQDTEYQRKYHKEYYANKKNAQIAKERAKLWYRLHPEVAKARANAHYHTNKILKGRPKGEKVHNWKGDDASYSALHYWVVKWKGRPSKCEHCGLEDIANPRRFEWANKSQEYKRELDDWLRLCKKCHWRYDQSERLRGFHGRLL